MMTILRHIAHLIPVVGLGYVAIFLYPEWLNSGYLDDWYPRIGAGVATYGGFLASLVWYILNWRFI